jgi:hypothetical protein
MEAASMNGAERQKGERRPRPRPRRLSVVFTEIADAAGERVSLASLVDALGDRSFAALLLFFAAINLLPWPPGVSTFLGAPMLLIAGQMAWGSRRVWLPKSLRDRSIAVDQFRTAVRWMVPRLERLERLIRPRYWPFWRRQGERIVGIIALLLSVIVVLPIPLGNWLPSLSIAVLSLAMFERDGLLLAIGSALGVTAVAVTSLVVGSVAVMIQILWNHAGDYF